ncbi:OmpA family protein [Methylotenera sp. G11]|uniref:OmpA family protein n=1 Tax=Methylotenera sp. G11 TaxID=1506585 RepID=UPI000647D0B7|nr:OmpA family protein [Methylotenera sp. G11]
MNNINNQLKTGLMTALIAAATVLPGCATSGSKLSQDGASDKIVFPDANKAWLKEAVDPNVDNLRRIAPGMTKDNIYSLIGRPHFSEGIIGVREWDYVFNFRKSADSTVQTCQYKIVYAPDMHLRSTYWQPESCADMLKPDPVPTQTVIERIVEKSAVLPRPEAPRQEVVRIRVAADGVFEFDKSGISDLRPGGIEKLNKVAEQLLASGEITQLKIIGHTDRLGDDAYNQRLSVERAEAIRQYLARKSVTTELASVQGAGKSQPLVECRQTRRDEALIRCLEPNRRFEIEAWTVSKQ